MALKKRKNKFNYQNDIINKMYLKVFINYIPANYTFLLSFITN